MEAHPAGHPIRQIAGLVKRKPASFWEHERATRPVRLFQAAAKRVPAYRDFLKKRRIDPVKIKTPKDLALVPPVTKKNYLREYPLPKLCWGGHLEKNLVWTATSGSTGVPFYFPRGAGLDLESSAAHEIFVNQSSHGSRESTLVIVAFGMGVWIGGLITYKAFELLSREGEYPVSILTTGINKGEIMNALRHLAPQFRQTIIAGYPPFVKDVLDDAEEEGIELRRLNIRFLFAAEVFTEKFRDYISARAGVKNPFRDVTNIYGTADLGTMAWETPWSILMRRTALSDKPLFRRMFSAAGEKIPTFAQFNPMFVNFEEESGELLITGDNAIPLVRYAIGDMGGVWEHGAARRTFVEAGADLSALARAEGLAGFDYKLPFVYVYERSDLAASLYGLKIYPEGIREALLEERLSRYLTGKFTMLTRFDKRQNQFLEINLELRKNRAAAAGFRERVLKKIMGALRSRNSEFRELSDYLKGRAAPKLHFWPAEHPLHFKAGAKQKWVKK